MKKVIKAGIEAFNSACGKVTLITLLVSLMALKVKTQTTGNKSAIMLRQLLAK